MAEAAPVWLPAPRVRFAPDFARELARRVAQLPARRGPEAGGRALRAARAGFEPVGARAYRFGDDPRLLDWALWARSGEPHVRLVRAESSARVALAIHTVRTLGLGEPGKLQLACELAAGVALAAVRAGSEVEVWSFGDALRACALLRRPAELPELLRALQGLEARSLGAELRGLGARRCQRLVLLSDFLDLEPAAVAALARPGRELVLVQVLAAEELLSGACAQPGPTEWIDARDGARRPSAVSAGARARYRERLARQQAGWRTLALRLRARWIELDTSAGSASALRTLEG